MSWKDKLQPASFRRIPFTVTSSNVGIGRKTTTHEFPNKDTNYVEDLGRETRTFAVEADVAGNDYKSVKDALMEACEQPGPGPLVHPYFGNLTVQVVGKVSIRENSTDGGMAIITIPFSETERPNFPVTSLDSAGNLLDTAESFFASLKETFETKFDLFQQAQSVVDNVNGSILGVLGAIDIAMKGIKGVSGFQDLYNNIVENIENITLTSEQLGDDFIGLFSLGTTDDSLIWTTNQGVIETLTQKDYNVDNGVIEINQASMEEFIRFASVTGACQAISNIDFKSVDQSEIIKDLILPAIDDLMDVVSDNLYSELHELRAAVLLDIETRSQNLPIIIEYKLATTLPSPFVAYDLYENIEMAQDISDRNNVVHPGFVPGKVDLEVLSRE